MGGWVGRRLFLCLTLPPTPSEDCDDDKAHALCSEEFGSGWRVAAWETLASLPPADLATLMHMIHADVHKGDTAAIWEAKQLVVSEQGSTCQGETDNWWFMIRTDEDGNMPDWMEYVRQRLPGPPDHTGATKDLVVLGRWTGEYRVLCWRKHGGDDVAQNVCDNAKFYVGNGCQCPAARSPSPPPPHRGMEVCAAWCSFVSARL